MAAPVNAVADRSKEKLLVNVRRLTHLYQTPTEELVALREVSLQVAGGERIAVVGPSGSGKTTLLNILAALQTPSKATVWVGDRDLASMTELERVEYRKRQVGYAWQHAEKSVWPCLTAFENVLLPMLSVELPERDRYDRAAALLGVVGLHRRHARLPGDLSYGDRRRLGLAVALANHPPLLLADEVTAGLDEDAADQLLADLNRLLGELGASAIIVAHGRHLPRRMDRIVALPYPRPVTPPETAGRVRKTYDRTPREKRPNDRRDVLLADSVSRQLPGADGPVEVVRDVSFRIREAEMVAILGTSGAGKSVLLAMCAGLERPDAGSITVEGQQLESLRGHDREALLQRAICWVGEARPPADVTPLESVALAARISGSSDLEASRLARVALGATGLQDQAATPVGRLSGGEQARVAVARALARAPALIVADEPTAQLDILASMDIVGLLREAADSGIAVLLATHSPVLAEVADRVLEMKDGTLTEVRRR